MLAWLSGRRRGGMSLGASIRSGRRRLCSARYRGPPRRVERWQACFADRAADGEPARGRFELGGGLGAWRADPQGGCGSGDLGWLRKRRSGVQAATPAPTQPAKGPPEPEGLPTGYEDVPHEVVKTARVRRVIAEHMVRSRQTAAHMTTEVDVDLSTLVASADGDERGAARRRRAEALLPAVHRARRLRRAGGAPADELDLPRRADDPLAGGQPRGRGRHRGGAAGPGGARVRAAGRGRRSGRRSPTWPSARGPASSSPTTSPAAPSRSPTPARSARSRRRRSSTSPRSRCSGCRRSSAAPGSWPTRRAPRAIEVRPILRLAVTFDHRAVDGADATRFAVAVKDELESWGPEAYA